MKKTYSAPKANAMSLHIENEILSGSDLLNIHDKYTSADQLSEEKGWSSNQWADTDED